MKYLAPLPHDSEGRKPMRTSRKIILVAMIVHVILMLSRLAHAQPVTPANSILWDQGAPDLATANGYTFKYYPDGATTGITFTTAVTCTGTAAPFTCKVAYPAFTPGTHTVQVTASNVAGESPKSAVFSFTFAVVPAAPANLRSGN